MNDLHYDIEWQDPGGARGPELRATWARLRINVGDQTVTRVIDPIRSSIRAGIYGPLYPVAEWIVVNWWALMKECYVPGRSDRDSYSRRHNLRFAAEGYAMPWFELRPTRGRFEIEWRPSALPYQQVHFVEEGFATVRTSAVEESLTRLVDTVVDRLESQSIEETLLQKDWHAIQTQSREERDFCEAAGAMGLDPFDLGEQTSERLIQASRELGDDLASDFFEVADAQRIQDQLEWVRDGLKLAQHGNGRIQGLSNLRNDITGGNGHLRAWEEGYALARRVRELLGIDASARVEWSDLAPGEDLRSAILEHNRRTAFDAIAVWWEEDSPRFVLRQGGEESRRFTFCRALLEYIDPTGADASLISASTSDKQKRNRAFAAEFLAPASALRDHITRRSVDQYEVEELASRFGVSTMVILHQVQNHHLGEIAEA